MKINHIMRKKEVPLFNTIDYLFRAINDTGVSIQFKPDIKVDKYIGVEVEVELKKDDITIRETEFVPKERYGNGYLSIVSCINRSIRSMEKLILKNSLSNDLP